MTTYADAGVDIDAQDQALATKVLRTANSAFYGFPRKITTINYAIVVLGLNNIKNIVLSSAIINGFSTSSDAGIFDRKAFWEHSLACGILARKLSVHLEMKKLGGKQVEVRGKVVKVNNGIMKRNFLHIQDGTGKQGTNDLIVTSNQTAEVDDEVTITGTVVLDTDFGFGYKYPLLVENSTIKNHSKK